MTHSVIATVASTVLVVLLAVPAAYALAIHPVKRWQDGLFFFISTKMLPIVAAIGPLYVIALKTHLLDNIWLLVILYTAMNLPLAIWLIRSFMLEVPGEMLEAAELDGAGRVRQMGEVRGLPHRVARVHHPAQVPRAVLVGPAGAMGRAAVVQVRVLDRVQVDGLAVRVLRPVRRAGRAAAVEGRGVVRLDRDEVGA